MHDLQCVHQCTCLKYGHIHTESGVGVYVLIPLTIPYEYFTEHNCVTVLVSQQCLRCMLVCVGEPGYKVLCELYIFPFFRFLSI